MTLGSPYSKAVIDHFLPRFSNILGELICLIGVIIGTYTGEFTIAGPVIQAFAFKNSSADLTGRGLYRHLRSRA